MDGNKKPDTNRKSETAGSKTRARRDFHRKQRSTSIFFLLCSLFTAFSLILVLVFGLTQRYLVKESYKQEASYAVADKGEKISDALKQGPPPMFGENNYSGYLRFLSASFEVQAVVLDDSGHIIFPREPSVDESSPEWEKHYNLSAKLDLLKANLSGDEDGVVLYEGDGEYVYGERFMLYGDTPVYLHVGNSLELMETTLSRMGARILTTALFVMILSFAVSFALSGWLVGPITEMTKKAQALASGDFNVDFQGKEFGRELVELADALNFARDELSKTDRMQKELIANVSHDFKTPLTMIKAYASMIVEISGNNPEKRNKHAGVIIEEADRLASLVSDVLDLSKIRSDIEQLQAERLDMSAYLDEILSRFSYLKEMQGYKFVVERDEGLFTIVDKTKIGQALYNLIGNAVNYTGEDKTVCVRLKRQSEEIFRFEVRDTGAGIKKEELGEIWDRYYRSSSAHKRPVSGTGLGLSIVKTILEKHGFAFGVESEEGKGSTFYVDFPLVKTLDSDTESGV